MKHRYIAVLCNNFANGLRWLKSGFDPENVEFITASAGRATMKNGDIYQIVMSPEQAQGYEFDDYVKAPGYYTLEDVVKSRLHV